MLTRPIGVICLAVLFSCGREPTTSPVTPPVQATMPITGTPVPAMSSYDQLIPDLMRKYDVPGGAVAVMHRDRLIYARGYGYADVENETLVQPDALFRIASVSKPITAVAILKLIEEGRLDLDDRVAPLLDHLAPAEGATVDPRWNDITIRHLLNHTGGWDRGNPNGGFDPLFRHSEAAAAVDAPAPASPQTLVRYMKGMPLDFNPGERHVYSNFGYVVLGRVIERLSGMPYEEYVRTRVLQPAGAQRTRQGRTRLADALPDEVKYYLPGQPGLGMTAPLGPSVFPGEGNVPVVYGGGFYLEMGDASGAWVSSTVDLLRFVAGVDGDAHRPDVLNAGLVTMMTSTGPVVCSGGGCYYAFGWLVRPTQGDANWWHTGSLPGTTSILVRSYHNFAWVALFNAGVGPGFTSELDAILWNALGSVTSVPTHDLFSTFR